METWKAIIRFSAAAAVVLALAAFSGTTTVLHATQHADCQPGSDKLCVHTDGSGTVEYNSYCDGAGCGSCSPTSERCDPFGSGIDRTDYWTD